MLTYPESVRTISRVSKGRLAYNSGSIVTRSTVKSGLQAIPTGEMQAIHVACLPLFVAGFI